MRTKYEEWSVNRLLKESGKLTYLLLDLLGPQNMECVTALIEIENELRRREKND